MRALLLAAAIVTGAVGAAAAATLPPVSDVSVTIGPELQAKADKYGQRELDLLSSELKRDVTRALERAGSAGPGGARLELVLADAKPNRPTYKQLSDHPGLSIESFGVGGARIEGRMVYPD